MNSILFVVRRLPGPEANETMEAALTCAIFGQAVTVLFLDDGVWQLISDQPAKGTKSTSALVSALPDYEVTNILVDRDSLEKRGIPSHTLPEFARVIEQPETRECLRSCECTIPD